MHYIKEEEEQN